MGSYTDVKNLIISNIKANGQREITGPILQDVLLNMLENSSRVEEITYSDLKALRDDAKLTPSRLYRITDYTCTTSQANTRSAGHQFDIIVTADDESTLNEVARAIKHEDDTYFADCDLNAWKIWYCLDNDTTRFAWADEENGKGVIYRMIDEFNNDVPYDFKNIQFYRKWAETKSLWSTISSDNTGVPCYTFSSEGSSSTTSFTDMSLNVPNNDYSNVIKEYISSNKQTLNNNCFFGTECLSNTLGNNCYNNSFGGQYKYNSFGDYCQFNSFGNFCSANSLGDYCAFNTLGYACNSNTFGNNCYYNTFGSFCSYNSFGNGGESNSFGSFYRYNSFGNGCYYNSFRVNPSTTSALKNYVYYNHFDDGCSYNVIWNSNTTSSSALLKNININRGVVGTSSSYNMITIDVLNSEQEINVNQVDGIVSISNISDILKKLDKIIELSYSELVTLRDNAQLIPGQQYRIIDYITTTTQENTKSAGHQFDIIVTALDESTLSEEAQAIQNSVDGYFDDSNLSAWKIWYCLDNDTNRFSWAGDNVKVDEIERKKYDSSQCTIKPELINDNEFITPFNFESCVWVDGNNDDFAYSDDHIHHDISELIYEWGYFADDNGDTQLCIYKSDADLYAEEGRPDYGDKYLYRGVVNVDGAEYDYWQKWDEWNSNGDGGLNIHGGDDYVYATTRRIVSNPEAYSATIETEVIYGQGKGVIYRMIDEWNNDIPYDFKNIQYNGSWGYWAYTFNWINDDSDNTCEDLSVEQYAHTNDEGGYSHTYGNIIKPCENADNADYGFPIRLNACVFLNTESYDSGTYYGCSSNIFGNNCYDNTFGNDCKYNTFGDGCSGNSFGSGCYINTFGNYCSNNTFGDNCHHNTFGSSCCDNTFGATCRHNTFDSNCSDNTFGAICNSNTFGSDCQGNTFGACYSSNSFGNRCSYVKLASDSSASATKYNYYQYNHFGDGCKYILFKGTETASLSAQVQNYNLSQGLQGTSSAYLTIDGVRNLSYEAKVAKNSKGEIKIYCEADLIT